MFVTNLLGNTVSYFQALYVNPLDSYNIHWPIRRGQLNLHTGPGGSLTAVLADLEVIWSHAIQKYLEIPLKDLKVSCEHINVGCIHSLHVTIEGNKPAVILAFYWCFFYRINILCW